MLEYAVLKRDRRKLLALTGLTVKEFKVLLPPFNEAYHRTHESNGTLAGHRRRRRIGGGRRGQLDTPEQKLVFILVYQKTYPLQTVMGELFGFSQAAANQWIHRLLPVLQEALTTLGVMPERDGPAFAQAERSQGEPADYILDGTERRRQRPKDAEKQALHYSGKKKVHSDKNLVIVTRRSKRVGYLGPTHAGKTHDKKMADEAQITYPRKTVLRKDTGFQGYEPPVQQTHQPKKSRVAKT
jgi:DDE superfamily endonuclease/Helix-turn-helix of DDE superfamily endonuclease